MDIKELEQEDYDLLENIKAAFHRLWKLKLVVILSALVGLLAFFMFLSFTGNPTVYQSAAGLYSAMYGSYEDSAEGVRAMNTYASMLGTSSVCTRAAETLGDPNITAEDLANMVRRGQIYLSGASSNSSEFGYRLTLVTALESSNRIVDVTNAMAQAFSNELNDFLGVSTLRILDPATTYYASQSVNVKLLMVLFGAAGFFMSAAVIFIHGFFSSKVYTIGQCEKNRDLILGITYIDH